MTELQKLQAGLPYKVNDPEIKCIQNRAVELLDALSATPQSDAARRSAIIHELFGTSGHNVTLRPGFGCDMGVNIHVGENFYTNYNVVILDMAPVRIGNNVLIGPGSALCAVAHPEDAQGRYDALGIAQPITIGNCVWIGANVTIRMGVTIGDNAIIGGGAVVTHDVPANAVVVGCPERVLKYIDNSNLKIK